MISCIDFNKETLGRDLNQFPDEIDIHRKIDRFVEDYHKNKKRKSRRTKTNAVSLPRNNESELNITIKDEDMTGDIKKESRSFMMSHTKYSHNDQRISKHSPDFPKSTGHHQMHSVSAK